MSITVNRGARQDQLAEVSELLEECRGLSKGVGVAVLCANYPGRSKDFFNRRFELIMAFSPDHLVKVLGHPDPTGERATNYVLAERGY